MPSDDQVEPIDTGSQTRRSAVVLNGPNLCQLGRREPAIYGSGTLDDIEVMCNTVVRELDISLEFRQSNHEGELVSWIHEYSDRVDGIVLNAGAYSHTSLAIADAIRTAGCMVIEVHLSNVFARETFRHSTPIAAVSRGGIFGLGSSGYVLALRAIAEGTGR